MPPLVSIIIPTFNRRPYLPAAIDSVLGQTLADLELIVVDDGSTDDTVEVIKRYAADPRLKYVFQANQGRSAARNHGARLASGRWLAFLDSDDRFLPDALAAHQAAADQEPTAAVTLGGYEYVDAAGTVLGDRRPWQEADASLSAWLFNCLAMPGSVMIQRTWFDRLNGFDPSCEITEDWDLLLRLAHAGAGMAWVKGLVCQYRQHADNSVHNIAAQSRGASRTLDKLFSQAKLPGEIRQLANRARGWSCVVSAQRALAAGSPKTADFLAQALQHDPQLMRSRRKNLLEALLAAPLRAPGNSRMLLPKLARSLPPEFQVRPGELRRAGARAEMAQFFAAVQRGAPPAESQAYLGASLRLNPFWILNRGICAYCLRLLLRPLRPVAA